MFLFLMHAALAAPPAPTTFEFVGQPDCISLTYTVGQTELVNRCDAGLLLDQSVKLPTTTLTEGRVPVDTTTTIKDLSAFTVGLNGQLFRVVAVITQPAKPSEPSVASGSEDTGP